MVKIHAPFQSVLFWLTLLVSLLALPAHSADLVASVSKNKVVKNEVFQLRIVSHDKVSADALDFSQLEPDFFVGQPSFASSTNIINGNYSQRSEWTVALAAQKVGIVTIPSFQLGSHQTSPITIQVTEDQDQPAQEELAEVRSRLERTELYPGESTLFHAQLIIKEDIRRLRDPSITPPKVGGMRLESASEPKQYPSVLNGVEVTIVEQSFRVTAEQAGQFTLSEPVLKAGLLYGNQYSGNTRLIPILTKAKNYSIQVLEKPKHYQGTWLPTAKLSLTQEWQDGQQKLDSTTAYSTQVGHAITREIRLQVSGLTQQQLPNIHIPYPESISVYAEKPQFSTLDSGDTVMTFKQVLIPRQAGEIHLPEFSLNWWNTQTQAEQTSQVAGLALQVKPSEETPVLPTPSQPSTPEIQQVVDAGYWPYITLLLALLWLSTALLAWMLWRHKYTDSQVNHKTKAASNAPSCAYQAVLQAIEQQDLLALSPALRTWQKEVMLNQEEEQTLTALVHTLQQACFSERTEQPDFNPLKNWLVAKQKQQGKMQRSRSSTLPPL
ncbi:protein BatD [Vibrio cholerae]|uniref:BatD family protein n=1 Tax=Vibrio cholerae TaxID=666 RepID=UPI0011F0E214|nr:BatD family protein [Vibrio cholerae]KAA0999870.1 protein BatD [Vibrio cholerae]KAA1006765.1 protein BatD [Vibrio cholerae]KAA1015403.1 protein BatD [Vibrio cholerae]KAA1020396.1 protein BatD [Vibrio cholerae]KAA1025146.1 protein BatD [Vibrio cholerae]